MNDPSADSRDRARAGAPGAPGEVFDPWSESVGSRAFAARRCTAS